MLKSKRAYAYDFDGSDLQDTEEVIVMGNATTDMTKRPDVTAIIVMNPFVSQFAHLNVDVIHYQPGRVPEFILALESGDRKSVV